MDRYNHDIGDDTDETEESPLFSSFSSYSPQYRKQHPPRPTTVVASQPKSLPICSKNIETSEPKAKIEQTTTDSVLTLNPPDTSTSNIFLKNNCALTPGLRKLNVRNSHDDSNERIFKKLMIPFSSIQST
jgi:microtubule-associated serine/threonine kinase